MAQTSLPVSGRIRPNSARASASPLKTPALSGENSIVTTGLMFSVLRMVSARWR